MKVQVVLPDGEYGFFNGSRVKAGKELEISEPKQFSFKWMRPLEAFPKEWKPTKAMCKVRGEFALDNPEEALKQAVRLEAEEKKLKAKADSDEA